MVDLMIPRDAESTLRKLAQGYPVLAITGPRQAGKTTLAKHVFGQLPYVSFENPDTREHADADPRGFLERYLKGAVFDEVLRCPELFSYLQEIVDRTHTAGRFVLTGSQHFGLMSSITQSLAGRVALVHLLPFSFHECYQHKNSPPLPTLDELLYTGFYPPIHDKQLDPRHWYANYLHTYVERDVRQLVNVRDLSTFQRFVRLCAARTGQLLNLSNLANDCGITHNTAKSWLSILEASYVIFLLQPHHANFNKRLIKTPKLYFYDCGLASWLLGIQNSDQLSTHSLRGALFETWITSEAHKFQFNQGLPGQFYFWRDRSGHEIDLVIARGEKLQPIEMKSGKTLTADYVAGLKQWMSWAGSIAVDPTIIYGGEDSCHYDGVKVYSWKDNSWQY